MHPGDSETKKDLQAAVHTARELGPEYENEVIDGFLQRLENRLDAQVAVRVRRELDARGERPAASKRQRRGDRVSAFQYFSLVLAVPLSAIGAGVAHLPGLLVAWGGIVGVNFVQLRAQRLEGMRSPRRDDWE
ncbi:hypothetical protein ABIA33_005458 [Streptacidiphilus sp. MAP12-16]|uniref:hypothetical protein n=1 Tax=Streptacidiphilus sp. MAP12-16 TaxID=3156300 RepID=UPI003511B0F8